MDGWMDRKIVRYEYRYRHICNGSEESPWVAPSMDDGLLEV